MNPGRVGGAVVGGRTGKGEDFLPLNFRTTSLRHLRKSSPSLSIAPKNMKEIESGEEGLDMEMELEAELAAVEQNQQRPVQQQQQMHSPLSAPMPFLDPSKSHDHDRQVAPSVPSLQVDPQPLLLQQQQHPSGIIPTLQNIVATVNMGCRLDLKEIALHARNAEYNPKVPSIFRLF